MVNSIIIQSECMKIRFTKYGRREIAIVLAFSAVSAAAVLTLLPFMWWLAALPVILTGFILYFFRHPHRNIPAGEGLFVAPADGRITDIEICREDDYLGEETRRISIFLSVFDVHINRAPCAGKVEHVKYRKGKYLNALRKKSAVENERNDVCIRFGENGDRVLVRQISGALARRIVCDCARGDSLERGRVIGMIKLGSRTDLFVPARLNFEVLVKVGTRVKAGETVIGRLA